MKWKGLLELHDAAVRREVRNFEGQEINTTETDSYLHSLAPPERIQFAQGGNLETLGLDIRAGLHTGQCERRRNDLSGLASMLRPGLPVPPRPRRPGFQYGKKFGGRFWDPRGRARSASKDFRELGVPASQVLLKVPPRYSGQLYRLARLPDMRILIRCAAGHALEVPIRTHASASANQCLIFWDLW
jgi:hypothetical protein